MKLVGYMLMCAILLLSVLHASIAYLGRRIFRAEYPTIEQYPYSVYLESKLSRLDDYHYCSGALVSQERVLTSALCMSKYISANGVWKKPMAFAMIGAQHCDSPADKFKIINTPLIHPDFRRCYDASDNDLAIVDLEKQVEFGQNVDSIRLDDHNRAVEINERLTVLGYSLNEGETNNVCPWGHLSQLDFYTSKCTIVDFPVKVSEDNLPICHTVHVGSLTSNFNKKSRKYTFTIDEEGYEPHIAAGDFGGPVVRLSNKMLVGITSGLHYNKTTKTLMAIHSAIHAKKNQEFLHKHMREAFS